MPVIDFNKHNSPPVPKRYEMNLKKRSPWTAWKSKAFYDGLTYWERRSLWIEYETIEQKLNTVFNDPDDWESNRYRGDIVIQNVRSIEKILRRRNELEAQLGL